HAATVGEHLDVAVHTVPVGQHPEAVRLVLDVAVDGGVLDVRAAALLDLDVAADDGPLADVHRVGAVTLDVAVHADAVRPQRGVGPDLDVAVDAGAREVAGGTRRHDHVATDEHAADRSPTDPVLGVCRGGEGEDQPDPRDQSHHRLACDTAVPSFHEPAPSIASVRG